MTNNKPTGYLLHETNDVAIVATLVSENEKTGNMIQIWIMYRHASPLDAVKSGADETVCFNCIHRADGNAAERTCYVNLVQGLGSVWRTYSEGKYPKLAVENYARVFANRAVRFGAYGEPILIPLPIVRAIVAVSNGHTGYTHQWRNPQFAGYRDFIMASCDAVGDYAAAKALGWRTFRVRTKDGAVLPHEVSCPASDEMGKRTQCVRCKLCSGSTGHSDARKDIVIIVHGSRAKNFVSLDSIAAA